MQNGTSKRLIIAPHCDDAEFGVGGLLAKRSHFENHVIIAAASDYVRSDGVHVTAKMREAETHIAMELLGVKNWKIAGWFNENEGLTVDYRSVIENVEEALDQQEWDEVFICLPSYNQDHTVLFDALQVATRPGHFTNIGMIWAYEYPGNMGTLYSPPQWGRSYNVLDDTAWAMKMTALDCHVSQWGGRPDRGVNPASARILGMQRGREAGTTFAECYYLLREIFQ